MSHAVHWHVSGGRRFLQQPPALLQMRIANCMRVATAPLAASFSACWQYPRFRRLTSALNLSGTGVVIFEDLCDLIIRSIKARSTSMGTFGSVHSCKRHLVCALALALCIYVWLVRELAVGAQSVAVRGHGTDKGGSAQGGCAKGDASGVFLQGGSAQGDASGVFLQGGSAQGGCAKGDATGSGGETLSASWQGLDQATKRESQGEGVCQCGVIILVV
jgi:hypothetical protein